LDLEWNKIKEAWKKKSLLLLTPVATGESVRISQRLISHHIPLTRTAFDTLSINDRIQLGQALQTKAPEVQAAFKQLRFLKSFLRPGDEEKFNFFIISASWCDSCREYRNLFESYFKAFPAPLVNLHSVVIEDPKEEIFDARILKELFPNPKKYSHNSIPRFLALESVRGKTTIWEEGEALQELYERFYKLHHGFLNPRVTLFRNSRGLASGGIDPSLTAVTK
jgi:hypothetical protein